MYVLPFSALLGKWAPRTIQYMKRCLRVLEKRNPALRRPCEGSVFPSSTVNLGPQTVTKKHRDHLNLASTFCAITALGSFDSKTGGHLVLWELKLVIEFPPGTTILIPSAFITHSNLPVKPQDVRYSFTQYASGRIFQWIENGFQTNKELFHKMEEEDVKEWLQGSLVTWEEGVQRFGVWSPDTLQVS